MSVLFCRCCFTVLSRSACGGHPRRARSPACPAARARAHARAAPERSSRVANKMGKKKAAARDTGPAQTFSVPSASLPRGGRSGPASNGGSGGGSIFGGGGGIEPGLCVRREKGLGFLSGVTCGVVALALIQLALAPTFPRLLAHWSWFIVTLYGTALCRAAGQSTRRRRRT